MNLSDLHGAPGFIVTGIRFSTLCNLLSKAPGLTFKERKWFFWSACDIKAQFKYGGDSFTIRPDMDDDGILITPDDEGTNPSSISALKAHLDA